MCIFQYRIISTRYPSFQRIEIYTTIVPIRNLSSKCIYHPKNTNIYIYIILHPQLHQQNRKSQFASHRSLCIEIPRWNSVAKKACSGESGWRGGLRVDLIRRKSFPVRVFEIVGEESCKTDTAAGM